MDVDYSVPVPHMGMPSRNIPVRRPSGERLEYVSGKFLCRPVYTRDWDDGHPDW